MKPPSPRLLSLDGDRDPQLSPCAPFLCFRQLLEGTLRLATTGCFIFLFHCLQQGEMAKCLRNSSARDDLRVLAVSGKKAAAGSQMRRRRRRAGQPWGRSRASGCTGKSCAIPSGLKGLFKVQGLFTMKQLGNTCRRFT